MFKFINDIKFKEHRAGWGWVLEQIREIQDENSSILLDTFMEKSFAWDYKAAKQGRKIPYRQPWVGMLHNPPTIAPWYQQESNLPANFLNTPEARESLKNCKGIYVFSKYIKYYLDNVLFPQLNCTHIPVDVLYHPTETPMLTWSPEKYEANRTKQIIQLGFWLRRLTSIYLVNTNTHVKSILLTRDDVVQKYLMKEANWLKKTQRIDIRKCQPVKHIPHQSNEMYDKLLSENVMFIDLYDSSCNNSIIECIVRNTPVLVNKIYPVVEYLGENYPLYFTDLDEVRYILNDKIKILAAHEYLKNMDKEFLSGQYLLRSIKTSNIYLKLCN